MKNIINRILEGEFHPDAGILDFSCAKIELSLYPGQAYDGSFIIYGPPGLPTEGFVGTADLSLELYTKEFAGKESEIAFCFHADKSKPGDLLVGEFTIISNHGEYIIPYEVKTVLPVIESSLGPVKNLFHFTNLAKTNWDEALTLFYSPSFMYLLHGSDQQYLTTYCGLSGSTERMAPDGVRLKSAVSEYAALFQNDLPASRKPKNNQNMEEFLLAIKKKQKIEYLIGAATIHIKATNEEAEYLLPITRNGWGFSELNCRADGDFLICDKDVIRDEDYLANVYKLPYYINNEKLHCGNNFGQIRLYNAYTEISIPITVQNDITVRKSFRRHYDEKNNIFQLMHHYIAFRTKQINQTVWRKETAQIIDRMMAPSDQDLRPKLFRIHLLITEKRLNEASRLLNHADNMLMGRENEEPELWCYYLYLTTLENRDAAFTGRVAHEVERFYVRNRGNWQIGWLLCYLKEEYVTNPAKKWAFLRELVSCGCRSPIILVEAWQLLKQKPELLTRLDDFEIRLLLFAARRRLIPKGLIPQIVYLIGKSKAYSPFFEQILLSCDEISSSDEVVQAMCELLIKGEKIGPVYFAWYLKGVQRDINITRLYEYFIFSLDQEKEAEIPKQVLLYFAYNSEIDYHYQAYIYAFVHKNRRQYPDIYESYRNKIAQFTAMQLSRARSGKWLAYLYKNFITPELINERNVSGLADIIFTVKIEILKEDIRDIVILYEKLNLEIINRISGKVANILLYGMDYQLFLVDSLGNRYTGTEHYRLEKWLNPDKIGLMIAPLVRERVGFDIWICEQGDEMANVTRENLGSYERVSLTNYLKSPYRETLCLNLIRFYDDFAETDALDKMLKTLKPEDIDRDSQEEIIKIMNTRGFYKEAYEWLRKTGIPLHDSKLILRILLELIPEEAASVDPFMLNLAFMSFSANKYDEKILNFLIRHYTGITRKLRDIWVAGKSFGLDTFSLSERLLKQMLFSNAFIGEQMEIFRDYVSGGGKGDLIKAFIIQNAYDYFVNDKVTDITIVRQMEKFLENDETLDFVCQLAYVKYFAENKTEIDERASHYLQHFLRDLQERNIVFAFYKEYIGILPIMDSFVDKTIIEYRTPPGFQATIHYLFGRGKDAQNKNSEDFPTDPNYIAEQMAEMYDGIFVKQFMLFYGDSVSYYISEEGDGTQNFTESRQIEANEISDFMASSRFSRINDIEIAREMHDNETFHSLLAEYTMLDFLTGEMFETIV